MTDLSDRLCPDAYVTKFSPTGNRMYSVTFGGRNSDGADSIAVGSAGNVYLTGGTWSATSFPTVNPLQSACGTPADPASDDCYMASGFITVLNASGSSLSFSTYLTGNDTTDARSIAVSLDGTRLAVAGGTLATTLAGIAGDVIGSRHDEDAFLLRLTRTDTAYQVRDLTFMGGIYGDEANGVAMNVAGDTFVVGDAASAFLRQPKQAFGGGYRDAFAIAFPASSSIPRYQTFIGGNGGDAAWAVAIGSGGEARITGYTESRMSFPDWNAPEGTSQGRSTEVFVTSLDGSGEPAYSFRLGGSPGLFLNGSYSSGIATSGLEDIYVAGYTYSNDFPGGTPNTDGRVLSRGFLSRIREDTRQPKLTITDANGQPVEALQLSADGWPVLNANGGALANPLTIKLDTTLTAQDTSGVAALRYSLDGTTFRPYTGLLPVNPAQVHTVVAFADDTVGNRSALFRQQLPERSALNQPVRPVLECVANNGNGTFTAWFGYGNDNSVAVRIPVGTNNRFSPNPQDRGQTTLFQPGRQQRVFGVTFTSGNQVWSLRGLDGNNRTATASVNSTRCATP